MGLLRGGPSPSLGRFVHQFDFFAIEKLLFLLLTHALIAIVFLLTGFISQALWAPLNVGVGFVHVGAAKHGEQDEKGGDDLEHGFSR